MGARFRIERLDSRSVNGSVALHVAAALDVTNRNDVDNRQARFHRITVGAGGPTTGTVVAWASSRSSRGIGTSKTRLSQAHGCAKATAQGRWRLGVTIRPIK
jgi:hypothetical protein